jgi:acetate kinase
LEMAGRLALAILSLNYGSSSLKFAIFDSHSEVPLERIRGAVEGISKNESVLWVKRFDQTDRQQWQLPPIGQREALEAVLQCLIGHGLQDLTAIGHRVVHSGGLFRGPALVDEKVLEKLRSIERFAPLHLPAQIAMLEASQSRFPTTAHVACFDTTFFETMPEIAKRYPLPSKVWDLGVRRYGFHGLSYESIVASFPEAGRGRKVIAHLGNGCSMTALLDGHPIDTTMGFTPAGGLMMGTRCGDLDPGVLLFLMERTGLGSKQIEHLVNHESGLVGVSETSSDMQQLLAIRQTDSKAALAIAMFCDRARKQIGAFAATLGGLDGLFFTAGIGERASEIRFAICEGLQFLGIEIEEAANNRHCSQISSLDGRCQVDIVPSNEELAIARQTLQTLQASS